MGDDSDKICLDLNNLTRLYENDILKVRRKEKAAMSAPIGYGWRRIGL